MCKTDHREAALFSETIKQAREGRGWTEEELSARCDNLTREDIFSLEKGELVPRLKICRQLTGVLDLDETTLLHKAYQEHVPEEMRVSLEKQSPEEALRGLFEIIEALDPAKRDRLAAAWRETLKLLQG